mgnify:CR=1 FL=1
MPRLTFFNLPEHKKQTLLDAAIEEFSRVPLAEASIANIVKAADIPRGSFYQYFENKEDLYFYLLNEELKEKRQKYINKLEKHRGDIFYAFTDLLQSFLIRMDDENTHQFYRNMFLNLNYQTEKTFTDIINNSELNHQFSEFTNLINTEKLNVKNHEEIELIVRMLTLVMTENIIQKFAKDLSNDEVIEQFTKQIDLLKRGFVKND